MESNDNRQEIEYRVIDDSYTHIPNRRTNTNAIIGFGLSLASLFVNFIYVLLAAAGMIFSIIGLSQISERGEKGKVYGILGIIIAAFVFIASVLLDIYS